MLEVIPKDIIDVWERWNIRGAIFLSLTLQAILVCFSPLRRTTSRRLFTVLVWFSYLLADWSANFAVGLISKNQGKESKPDDPPQDKKLMALWAPFLLLHLGGPDTITAFALEDNSLWNRHVFSLVFQTIAGVYAILQSLPNPLWLIILLVFISGTIKYVERINVMHHASLDNFSDTMIGEPDPGPNYAKLMEEYKAKKEARLPTKIILTDEPRPKKLVHRPEGRIYLHDYEIIRYGYKFFHLFKALVVNLKYTFRKRDESLEIFQNMKDPEEALRIIELELGLLYDTLFTKMGTVSRKPLRVIASTTIVVAFILFHNRPNKSREFYEVNILVTYILFIVGVAFDIPLYYYWIFDMRFSLSTSLKDISEDALSSWNNYFIKLHRFRMLRWKEQKCYHKCIKECIKEGADKCSRVHTHQVLATPFVFRKWCGSMKVFNFLAFATKAKVERIHDSRGIFRRYSWKIISSLLGKLYSIIQKLNGWVAYIIISVHRWISHGINEISRKHPLARRTIYPFYFEFLPCIPRCIKSLRHFISELFSISDMLDQVHKRLFVHGEALTKELWEFIFKELKHKSKFGDSPENAKRIYTARGEWTVKIT